MKMIFSNTAHDAYHRVLAELKKRLPSGGEHIVIVPDGFTASSERGVIATLGLSSVFNVSVTSFTRLAEKSMGAKIKKCLTPQGSVMLLAKVIEENRGGLVYYSKAARANGFAEEIYAALTALRNSGITPEKLRDAARRAPENVRGKFADMALIFDSYVSALGKRHSDSTTRLEAYAAWLKEGGAVPAHFYVVDFYDFKSPELDILAGLAKSAISLTVGMVGGRGGPNERIYCDAAADRLIAACGGGEIERAHETLHPALDVISRRLFSYEPPEERTECAGKVRLVAARTRTEEIDFLMREIVSKVRAGGRYRDFEVVVSDVEGYKAELKSAFLRSGIPFFIDTREMLSEQTKTRFLLAALAAVRSGLRRADVMEVVKNPLFCGACPEGEDAAFRFENYCLRYNVDHSRFAEPFKFGEEGERESAEAVRMRLAEALAPLAFKGEVSAEEFVERVRKFLDAFEKEWRKHIAKLTETSLYYAKCADQVDEKINSLLDELADTIDSAGDEPFFERLFKSAVQTVKIALVPTWLDCVYVGGTFNRYLGGGDVYILGANVGKLPAGASGGMIVSPRDEELLERLDVPVTPTSMQRTYAELMAVTEVMKRPKGTLVVCYPESDASGDLRPSSVVSELRGMLSENGVPLPVERAELPPLDELGAEERARALGAGCPTEQACLFEALRCLSAPDDKTAAAVALLGKEDRARVERMTGRVHPVSSIGGEAAHVAVKRMRGRTDASRLETYFACPYKYYFAYTLGLNEREEAVVDGRIFGILMHAVLEKFFKLIKRGAMTADKVRAEVERIFDAALEEDKVATAAMDDPGAVRAFERLRREAVTACRKLFDAVQRSKYKPLYIEAYIGGKELPSLKLRVGEEVTELRGRVDRVDARGDKFFVVDYKTGKRAEPAFADVYSGKKIQLYLYMQTIAEDTGMTPVGVFYLPLSFDFETSAAELRYTGSLVNDEEEARAMDPLFGEDDDRCIIPTKRARDGSLAPPVHVTPEQLRRIGKYVEALARDGAEEIEYGNIAPDALKGECVYCAYSGICAWQHGANGISTGSVGVDDFDPETTRALLMPHAEEEEL